VKEVYDTRRFAEPGMYLMRNCSNQAIEGLSKVRKEITGHVIPKEKKRRVNYNFAFLVIEEQMPSHRLTVEWKEEHTKFHKHPQEIDRRYARTVHGIEKDRKGLKTQQTADSDIRKKMNVKTMKKKIQAAYRK